MHLEVIQSYYQELTKPSLENAVDNIWANILPRYFHLEDGFGVSLQELPWPEQTSMQTGLTIRFVKNSQARKVCLVEDKRVECETSDSPWATAMTQLVM